MQGFILLHRSLLDWEWYTDVNTKTLFIHFLLKANHKDGNWRGIKIKRGDLITGRKAISLETGLTEQQIRTSLKKLISTNEITVKTTNLNSYISITNYKKYQASSQPINQPITNEKPTDNPTPTTNNNDDNKEEEKKDKKPKPSISEREIEFKEKVYSFKDKYPEDMLEAFYNYWSQKGENDIKMHYEKQKTFEVSKRLITWYGNNKSKYIDYGKTGTSTNANFRNYPPTRNPNIPTGDFSTTWEDD